MIKQKSGSITLYDTGGWFVIAVLLGVPFFIGSIFDYGWNYLVLHLTLKRVSPDSIRTRTKVVYSLIITLLGLTIDWLYYQITWGRVWGVNLPVHPIFPVKGAHPALELATILMPMAALALTNFALARLYLRLKPRAAVILSAAMGFFTAPWLIVLAVLLFQSGRVNL